MMAPKDDLSTRTYNVHAMSFTPEEIFEEVTSDGVKNTALGMS